MVPSEERNDFKDISASCWVTEPTLTNPNCSVFPLSWPLWSHAQATLSYIWAERKTKPERQGTQVGKPTMHCIKSQKGQNQLDPLCLKGGGGNKTPPPTDSIKKIDKQKEWTKKNKKTEVKQESLNRGGNKIYGNWPEEIKSQTLEPDFPSNRKHSKPMDGVDSLKTCNQQSRGTAPPSYRLPSDWLKPPEGEHHRCTQWLLTTWDLEI